MTNEELRSIRLKAIKAEREIEEQRLRIAAEMGRSVAEANHSAVYIKQFDKSYAVDTWSPMHVGSAIPETVVDPVTARPLLRIETSESTFRCASCSKTTPAGSPMAWLPDGLRRSDGYDEMVRALAREQHSCNGRYSGWCLDCIPQPKRQIDVTYFRFERLVLIVLFLPIYLMIWGYRIANGRPAFRMHPVAAPGSHRIAPAPVRAKEAPLENDDAAWCRRVLAADPEMTDASGVPLAPLVERDLPDLAARRDAMIAADPSRADAARSSYYEGVALIRAAIEEGVEARMALHNTGMDEKLRFLRARHPGAADAVELRRRDAEKHSKWNPDDADEDPNDFFEC